MGSKYPILRPYDIISALSKKGLFLRAKKEVMRNIQMDIIL